MTLVTEDIQGRLDIKGHTNVTNMLSNVEFYQHVTNTCLQLYGLLAEHCGPQATDALLIQDNDGRNLKDQYYSIFTKDGINIVRSVQFVSPIQRHIQDLVAYIGDRVDSLSHDGTTTAMMFFSSLVSQYFGLFADMVIEGELPDYREFRTNLLREIHGLSDAVEERSITIMQFAHDHSLTLREAIRIIAYWQAMISSKGDRELAEAIMEVVETLPSELYGLFTISQSGMETDRRFTVLHDAYNFMLPVIVNVDDMNHKMGTEFLSDDCDLIVSEDDLIRGNPALEIVTAYVEQARLGLLSRDLVIITKSLDSNLQATIGTCNRVNKHKIVVFTMSIHKPYSSRVTVLSAVMAVAGVHSLQDHVINNDLPYLISNVTVHYHNKRLYLSNLYEKDGSQYHPFFNDPEAFLPYTLMVDALRSELDGFISGRLRFESAADRARYEDFVEIYRRMISADVRNMQISGMKHDVLADRDVLQDAFGAVLSSLEHGFILDGYLKMYEYLGTLDSENQTADMLRGSVYHILKNVHKFDALTSKMTLNEYNKLKATPSLPKRGWYRLFPKKKLSYPTVFDTRLKTAVQEGILKPQNALLYMHYPIDSDIVYELNVTDGWKDRQIPLIQPADTYRELFKRIGDLLPKIINTSRAIIPGTVNSETAP